MLRISLKLLFVMFIVRVFSIVDAQSPLETPTGLPLSPTPVTEVILHVFAERDSLTIYVSGNLQVSMEGFEFRVLDSANEIQSILLADDFPALILTEGLAEPETCFIYRLAGTTTPLASACGKPSRIFRKEVNRADVFWYDSSSNQQRDIAFYQNGIQIDVCSATQTDCEVLWEISPLIVTPTISSTPSSEIVPSITSTPLFASPEGIFVGEWTSPNGYVYGCEITIALDSKNNITGQIVWTLIKSPRSSEQSKLGRRAIEYISGAYTKSQQLLTITGTSREDQYNIIGLSQYQLTFGLEDQTLSGNSYVGGKVGGTISATRVITDQ